MSLRGTYATTSNKPKWEYYVDYQETNRTSNQATYRVTLKVKMTTINGFYGYGISASCYIHGVGYDVRIKNPSPSWSGTGWQGTWSWTLTVNAGTGGGTLPAQMDIWGTDGASSPNLQIRGKTVSLSTWNTAPTWTSDDGNINDIKEHKVIPENTGEVRVVIPSATDREGNTIYYDVYRYVDDQQNAKVASGITSRSFIDNISAFGQGSKIKYRYQCHDGEAWSDYRWSWTYTKNTLTSASIGISGSAGFNTSTIAINLSGASNTNGDNSFTYNLSSSQISIYNRMDLPTNFNLAIARGNETPSGPYIKFDDLKNLTRNSSWQGSLDLRISTYNKYNSMAQKTSRLSLDLRTNPTPISNLLLSGGYTVAGANVFIPNMRDVTLSWNVGRDPLGGRVSYDIQKKIDSGNYQTIVSGLQDTDRNYIVKLDTVAKETKCKFKVITKSDFGYYSEVESSEIKLHYHNNPVISVSSINRTANEVSAIITTSTATSITSVAINSRRYIDLANKSNSFAGSPYTMRISGLTETQTGNITIEVTDNSGLPNAKATYITSLETYVPIVSIRKNGFGINAFATPEHKFIVDGNSKLIGTLNVSGKSKFNNLITQESNGITTEIGARNSTYCHYQTTAANHHFNKQLRVQGEIFAGTNYNQKVYHEGNINTVLNNKMDCATVSGYKALSTNTNQYGETFIRTTPSGFLPNAPYEGHIGYLSAPYESIHARTLYSGKHKLEGLGNNDAKLSLIDDPNQLFLRYGEGGSIGYGAGGGPTLEFWPNEGRAVAKFWDMSIESRNVYSDNLFLNINDNSPAILKAETTVDALDIINNIEIKNTADGLEIFNLDNSLIVESEAVKRTRGAVTLDEQEEIIRSVDVRQLINLLIKGVQDLNKENQKLKLNILEKAK